MDVTVKQGATAPEGGLPLPNGSVRFPAGTRVADIPGFEAGDVWVQDAAAAFPARLLHVQPGECVADLCAAPGGKTAQLAATGAEVTALERDALRMERLAANLQRWRLQAALVTADATTWKPPALFDAILLDAPCSATGTARRHPDVIRIKRPRDVQSVTIAQDQLLQAAAGMLRPGGRMIYAVCSLQPEEGAPRIAMALGDGRLRHDPFTPAEMQSLPEALTPEGYLRTHPGMWADKGGLDGFFAARLVRV
jgi:16S rRNA (cytosine967-C5)-methyltransferase